MTTWEIIALIAVGVGGVVFLGLLLLGAVAIGAYAVYRTKREDGYIMGPRPSDDTGTAVHLEDVGAFDDAEEKPLPEELLTSNLRFREIFGGKQ